MKKMILGIITFFCFYCCTLVFASEEFESIYYSNGNFYSDSTLTIELPYTTIEDITMDAQKNTEIYMLSSYELFINEIWKNNDYTITIKRSASFTNDYLINIPDTYQLEISDNVIIDGMEIKATKSCLNVTGNLTISGGIVQNCHSSNSGGGIYVSSGSLNLDSGAIINNYTDIHGGGIYSNNSDIRISGGEILNNSTKVSEAYTSSTGWGGGLYLYYSNLTMTGGNIDYNKGRIGGGLKIDAGVANISGGTINYNTALGYDGSGGGIYTISGATLNLSNCEIIGNEAMTNGGGIFPDGEREKITVSGSVIVKDNIGYYVDEENGTANDIYLPIRGGKLVTIEVVGSLDGSDIGIVDAGVAYSNKAPSVFLKNYELYNEEEVESFFFSDLENYKASADDNGDAMLKKYYVVNFYNDTELFSTIDVYENEPVSQPSIFPEKAGYNFLYWSTSSSGDMYDFSNIITNNLDLYAVWEEYTVTIEYKLQVQNDLIDVAYIENNSELLYAYTGDPIGPKLSIIPGYKLVGWYDSNDNLISKNIEWKPEKNEDNVFESEIYTAKIELALIDIMITVNNPLEQNQSYIFNLSGTPDIANTFKSLRVVVITDSDGYGTVTINDIPSGIYTVFQENNWTWRYVLSEQNLEKVSNVHLEENLDTYSFDFNDFIKENNSWLNGYEYYNFNT